MSNNVSIIAVTDTAVYFGMKKSVDECFVYEINMDGSSFVIVSAEYYGNRLPYDDVSRLFNINEPLAMAIYNLVKLEHPEHVVCRMFIDEIEELMEELMEENGKDKITTVVNSRSHDYDVYIGGVSKWGNPFLMRNKSDAERDRVCDAYEVWFKNQPELVNDLHELKGKVLGCFCKPKRCHGDFLAREANKIKIEE